MNEYFPRRLLDRRKGCECQRWAKAANLSCARRIFSEVGLRFVFMIFPSFSSIVLLDDPLSAVDAPTARHLLMKCILGSIMKGRTVILVSHAVSLVLPHADHMVIVKNGTISSQGPPRQLARGNHLSGIISDEILARGPEAVLNSLEIDAGASSLLDSEISSASTLEGSAGANPEKEESKKSEDERKDSGKLVKNEEMSTGSVRWSVYWSYFKAAGGLTFLFFFGLSYVVMFGADVANSWWYELYRAIF